MDKYQANVLIGLATKELGNEGDFIACNPEQVKLFGKVESIELHQRGWRVSLYGKQHNRMFGCELEGVKILFKLVTEEQVAAMSQGLGNLVIDATVVGYELCHNEDRYGSGWLEQKVVYQTNSNWTIVVPVTKKTINGYDLYKVHGRKWCKTEGAITVSEELFNKHFSYYKGIFETHFSIKSEDVLHYVCKVGSIISHNDFNVDVQESSYSYYTHATIENYLRSKIHRKNGYQWSAATNDCFQWTINSPTVFKDITWSDLAKNYQYGNPVSNTLIREWIEEYKPEMVVVGTQTKWYSEFTIEALQECFGSDFIYSGSGRKPYTINAFLYNGKALLVINGNCKQLNEWFNNTYCYELTNDKVALYQDFSLKVGHIRTNNDTPLIFEGGLYRRANNFIPATRPTMSYYNSTHHKMEMVNTFHISWCSQFVEELINNGYTMPEIISETDEEWIVKSNFNHDFTKHEEYWLKEYPRTERGYFIIKKSSAK